MSLRRKNKLFHTISVLLIFAVVAGILLANGLPRAGAATFNWRQMTWAGGANTGVSNNNTNEQANKDNWNTFYSSSNTLVSTTSLISFPFGDGADGAIAITTTKNINTEVIASTGRSYADGIAYRVITPVTGATSVTRHNGSVTISNGLVAGDEILLINMQGSATDSGNVGNYESLIVSSVSATTINFQTAINKTYFTSDSAGQLIVIQRVPHYTDVTIGSGGSITASAWDALATIANGSGAYKTGIVALRANGAVTISSGSINVSQLGYRGGNNGGCFRNQQGESIAGGLTATGNATFGAGGGGFHVDYLSSSGGGGGGYSTNGTSGGAGGSGSAGTGGASYGSVDLSKLYLGSGGGGAGGGCGGGGMGGKGGGIIVVSLNTLTLSSNGLIANGSNGSNGNSGFSEAGGGGGGAGGSILLNGVSFNIGTNLIAALGGSGGLGEPGKSPPSGNGGGGGDGRVSLFYLSSITGTTSPSAYINSSPLFYCCGTENIISSMFDTEDFNVTTAQIKWKELLGVASFQIQTAPDSAGAPGTWTGFVGTDGTSGTNFEYTDGANGCTRDQTAYPRTVTCNISSSINIGSPLVAGSDQWVQYKAIFNTVAEIDDVDLIYVINTEPVLTISATPSQSTAGTVTVNYTSASGSDVGETENMDIRLLYDLGIKPSGTVASGDLSFAVTGSNHTYMPSSGVVVLDNERLSYTKSGTTLTVTRGQFNTSAAQHDSTDILWIQTNNVSGHVTTDATLNANQAQGSGKSVVWTPKTNLPNLYSTAVGLMLTANDNQAARQVGHSNIISNVTIDTTDPVVAYTGHPGMASGDTGLTLMDAVSTEIPTAAMLSTGTGGTAVAAFSAPNSADGTAITTGWNTDSGVVAGAYVKVDLGVGNDKDYLRSRLNLSTSGYTGTYEIEFSDNASTWYTASAAWTPGASGWNERVWSHTAIEQGQNVSGRHRYWRLRLTNTPGNGADIQEMEFLLTATGNADIRFSKTNAQSVTAHLGLTDNGVTAVKVYLQDSTGGATFTPPATYEDAGYIALTMPYEAKTFNLNPGEATRTVTARFRDQYGNYVDDTYNIALDLTAPTTPTGMVIQENSAAPDYRLFIAWTAITDPGDFFQYNVLRSTDAVNFSALPCPAGSLSTVTKNFCTDNTVVNGTTYYYKVTSEDLINNVSVASQTVNLTAGGPPVDSSPLTISNVVATQTGTHTATVTWDTNKASDSRVYYASGAGGATALATVSDATAHLDNIAFVTTGHSVTLYGLAANTQYYVKVRSTAATGDPGYSTAQGFNATDNFTTQAGDTTAPALTPAPSDSNPNARSAQISATVSASPAGPGNVLIDLGTATGNYALGVFGTLDLGTTARNIYLPQFLTPGTTHYYRVRSRDDSYLSATASTEDSFATAADPDDVDAPNITVGPSPGTPASYGATITWTTSEASTSIVEYGASASYTNVVGDLALATSHSVAIAAHLTPALTYHYRVRSRDQMLNERLSADYTFVAAGSGIGAATISNIAVVSDLLPNTVRITWDTAVAADAEVLYSQDTSYSLRAINPAFGTSHSVTLTNLEQGKLYNYKVRSTNAAGSATTSNAATLATAPNANTAISITSTNVPPATSVTATTAVISWSTNVASNSYVEYGFDQSYGYLQGKEDLVTSHSVTLQGLLPQMAYHIRVRSQASDGREAASSDITLNPPAAADVIAPVITNISPADAATLGSGNQTQATITWTTNENADSIVEYGTTSGLGSAKTQLTDSTTSHSVTLTGLTAGTTYHYVIKSRDAAGNLATAPTSGTRTFVTQADTTAPVISSVVATNVTQTGATITWTTDEASTSQVEYALDAQFTSPTAVPSPANSEKVLSHSVVLSSLTANTLYYVRAKSSDAAGNPADMVSTSFTTDQAPDTTGPTIDTITPADGATVGDQTQATITWATNEAADSKVIYGTTSDSLTLTKADTALVTPPTAHSLTLTGLTQNTLYYYRIISKDAAANSTTLPNAPTAPRSFRTAADTVAPTLTVSTAVTNITTTGATVTWTTSKATTTQVKYGLDANLASGNTFFPSPADSAYVTSHSVNLSGLTNGIQYYVQVLSVDAAGNSLASSPIVGFSTLVTPDTTAPTISVAVAVNVTQNTATVTWTTNEAATSIVKYGSTSNLGSLGGDTPLTTNHSVTLSGLTPGAQYHYRVETAEAAGKITKSPIAADPPATFTTTADTTAPVISSVVATNVTQTGATITWTTDEASTSQVEYATNAQFTDSTTTSENSEKVTSHTVILGNLTSNTLYYIRAKSSDTAGNAATPGTANFTTSTTPDTTAPNIMNVTTANTTLTGATITWTTNENADSIVEYGLVANALTSTEGAATDSVTSHLVTLIGLTANTPYYYLVRSRDAAGNQATADNGGLKYTLTTVADTTAPVISSIAVTGIGQSQATVTWSTNEPATSQVEISTALDLTGSNSTTLVTDLKQAHSVTVTGLNLNTLYYYRVKSKDGANNLTTSSITSFSTIVGVDTTGPAISNVLATATSMTTATITWTTSENADHFVSYGTTVGLGYVQGSAAASVTSHTVNLTGLTAGQTYYYQVQSSDFFGNLTTDNNGGNYYTLTTAADTTPPTISNVLEANINDTSATITWDTNEAATTRIEYGTSQTLTGATFTTMITDPILRHSETLFGLIQNTVYYYRVRSQDFALTPNPAASDIGSFQTAATPDATAPNITNVRLANLNLNSVQVLWDTNEPSNSFVEYQAGQTIENANKQTAGLETDSVTSHTISLSGLAANTTFTYRVLSRDASGNLATATADSQNNTLRFTTVADTTAPIISDLTIGPIAQTAVTVSWTTDEDATARISYGATALELNETTNLNVVRQKSHVVTIGDLAAQTTYYFNVHSVDAASNEATLAAPLTFTTLATVTNTVTVGGVVFITGSGAGTVNDGVAPRILEIVVEDITKDSALVKWGTNEKADSLISYGMSTAYTDSRGSRDLVTSHSVLLTRLKPGTVHHYQITGRDEAGNLGRANDATFTTLAGPEATEGESGLATEISNVRVLSITRDSALVTWSTSTSADSQVRYGITSLYGSETETNPDKVKDHSVSLTRLSSGVTYHFQVISATATGNIATSPDHTFTTLSDSAVNIPPILAQGPVVEDIRNDSATITWITDRPSNSIVSFKRGGNLLSTLTPFQEVGNFTDSVIDHRINLIGLQPDSLYQYRVKSVDDQGNALESELKIFRTAAQASIKNISVTEITFNAALITWETVEPSSTELEFGKTEVYGDSVKVGEVARAHRIKLENLTPGSTYHFRVRGADSSGEPISSPDITFVTLGPPQILNLLVKDISGTEVEISWTTDKPTQGGVEYTNTATGKAAEQSAPGLSTDHAVRLANLGINNTYTYFIVLKDLANNVTKSKQYSFVTGKDNTAPEIAQVRTDNAISPKGDRIQTLITWKTNEPSLGVIEYQDTSDPTAAPQIVKIDDELNNNHVAVLTNFKPGKVYRFKIKSTDAAGNIVESKEFTTLTPRQQESVIDVIFKTFENSFGFLKKLQ